MAYSSKEIIDYLLANPDMDDAQIAKAMETYKISPAQMAKAVGLTEGEVVSRVAATIPEGMSVTLGDTRIAPQYEVRGSGEDRQVGGIENIYVEKTTGDVNYKAPVGSDVQVLSPTGELVNTIKTKEDQSFLGGLADALNDPVVQAAFLGLGGGGFLGNQLGLTGSAAQAVGTGLFKGGTALAGGADFEDALKTGLLSGGLVYGGNALNNYLTTGTVADPSITERAFATLDAKQLADQGLTATQIKDTLSSGGYNDITIERALASITPPTVTTSATTPVAVSTPVTDTVAITAPTTPSLNNVISTIAGTTPVTQGETVKVTAPSTQMTTQQAVDLVNSQIVANVNTPANLANVQVTAPKTTTTQDVINTIAATLPAAVATPTSPIATTPEIKVTDKKETPVVIPSVVGTTVTPPVEPPKKVEPPAETPKKKDEPTITDIIKVIAPIVIPALVAKAVTPTPAPTGFGIVPVPADWKSPPPTEVAPFTPLTPIDFGTRNLLKGTQWEKFLDPNYGKVPAPRQFAQPSNMSYNDLMSILDNKQGTPASNLTINDIISGIQNQYGQPVGGMVDNSVSRRLGGNLANATTGATTGATTARTTSIPNSVFNQMVGTTTGATNAGMLQKVYDPRTGRSFNSPAQAAQYGVTDYVTSLPSNIPLPASTQRAVDAYMAANKGSTVQQALDAIASPYKMTGEQLRDYDIQGTIRSADQQKVRDSVASQSGGLPIDQLVTKLQAFKANPPTTAQGLAEQGALYSDYANRYANTDYSYSNVGGRPQDVSLKPVDYLPTTFTGYSQPINQYLSSTNQMTPTFTMMQDILAKKPDINKAFQTVLAANPNAFKGDNSLTEATIRNLSSDIDQLGSPFALRNFYANQQNLLGLGSGFQNQNVSNPQYAALQKQIMDLTERVSDPLFSSMAATGIGKNEIGNIWRDPVSGLGIGTGQSGAMYFDRDGRPLGRSSIGDIGKTATEYGINLTGFTPPATL